MYAENSPGIAFPAAGYCIYNDISVNPVRQQILNLSAVESNRRIGRTMQGICIEQQNDTYVEIDFCAPTFCTLRVGSLYSCVKLEKSYVPNSNGGSGSTDYYYLY